MLKSRNWLPSQWKNLNRTQAWPLKTVDGKFLGLKTVVVQFWVRKTLSMETMMFHSLMRSKSRNQFHQMAHHKKQLQWTMLRSCTARFATFTSIPSRSVRDTSAQKITKTGGWSSTRRRTLQMTISAWLRKSEKMFRGNRILVSCLLTDLPNASANLTSAIKGLQTSESIRSTQKRFTGLSTLTCSTRTSSNELCFHTWNSLVRS